MGSKRGRIITANYRGLYNFLIIGKNYRLVWIKLKSKVSNQYQQKIND